MSSSKNSSSASALVSSDSNSPIPQTTATNTVLVGLDWGTNMSCVMAAAPNSTELMVHEQIPTVVGYANENVLEGVIPGDAKVLFGREAQRYANHLNVVRPLRGGVIKERAAARAFALHLRDRMNLGEGEIRAVVGMPASSDAVAREDARAALKGVFHKVIFVPEPFLAALGYRDESRLSDPDYQDPVLNSLYIDIGAGSTDVCLVQGHYPTVNDQLSATFAGDAVDQVILEAASVAYPDCGFTPTRIREFKEKHASVFNEGSASPAIVTVMVGGKPRKVDLTSQIAAGCDALLQKVFAMVVELIGRANPDLVSELLQNVIVTGGGSLMRGFGVALQSKLIEEGFENPRVNVLGQNYKDYVARGALKTARLAKDRQWQTLID
ncbi:MAG TPA: rod shape-determining protein [Opitutaceae bacterium]|nr:rod shape-determining protein [Opitutaceae bacterium]